MGTSSKWSPDRRQLRVLAALDEARTQVYHMSAILIAGMGMFTDAYDLFCITVISRLLGRVYYPRPDDNGSGVPGTLPIAVSAAVNGTALCGVVVGQVFCGWLGDKMGRKKVYRCMLVMVVSFSLASGLSFSHTTTSVMTTLCFFRFWLGFAIGGGCPQSATLMSEYSNTKTRGTCIAAVFAMQGIGMLAAGIVGMILAKFFDSLYPTPLNSNSTVEQADYLWRIMFMLGAFPALITYYGCMKMPETARYTALVVGNAEKAAEDMTAVLNIPESRLKETENTAVDVKSNVYDEKSDENNFGLFSCKFLCRHGLQLLGTASTWFLLDIVFYSQQLYQSQIWSEIGWIPPAAKMNGVYEVFRISQAQCLLAILSVPGYWVTVVLVDRIGRRVIQVQGFLCMSLLLCVLGACYCGPDNHTLSTQADKRTFFALYALIFFFANFGPNAITFIIPAELFPSRLRCTCHGLSAATGKAGAVIGAFGILYAMQPLHPPSENDAVVNAGYPPGIGMRDTFFILAAMCFLGALLTFLLPNTKNRSLERISGEKNCACQSQESERSNHPNVTPALQSASPDIRRTCAVELGCSPTHVFSDEQGR